MLLSNRFNESRRGGVRRDEKEPKGGWMVGNNNVIYASCETCKRYITAKDTYDCFLQSSAELNVALLMSSKDVST